MKGVPEEVIAALDREDGVIDYMADFEKDNARNNRPAAFVENPRPLHL